ncbi:MAG: hypothetical protein U1E76_04245 [Planctomycetota bacterium]
MYGSKRAAITSMRYGPLPAGTATANEPSLLLVPTNTAGAIGVVASVACTRASATAVD